MGQVDDLGVRIDPKDHALQDAGEGVAQAEVRNEGDYGGQLDLRGLWRGRCVNASEASKVEGGVQFQRAKPGAYCGCGLTEKKEAETECVVNESITRP